jgi:hypothetical protein
MQTWEQNVSERVAELERNVRWLADRLLKPEPEPILELVEAPEPEPAWRQQASAAWQGD